MEIGTGPIGSCSKDHQKIYLEWFNYADSGTPSFFFFFSFPFSFSFNFMIFMYVTFFFPQIDGDGRITGNDATKFFALSNLSRQDLKQV